MFSIQSDTFAGYTRYLLRNEQSQEYLAILPERGGVLQELVLANKDRLHSIIDGVHADELPGNMWYKSSLLFPFPGRIKDGTYEFEGKTYQLPINEFMRNSALHGLVADKIFQVTQADHNRNMASLKLGYTYDGSLAGYPFPYELHITYVLLHNHVFRLDARVRNTGNTNMPMGFGWHPYFRTGSVVDLLQIDLPSKKYYELDGFVVPTGVIKQTTRFTPSQFAQGGNQIGSMQFDHGFTGGRYKAMASTLLNDPAQNVTIKVTQWRNEGFNYTQIFTPSHRNSIAIEPQTCMANVFNNGIGLKVLAPGQQWSGSVSVHLL